MKKIFSGMLALFILCGAFMGCGNSSDGTGANVGSTDTNEVAAKPLKNSIKISNGQFHMTSGYFRSYMNEAAGYVILPNAFDEESTGSGMELRAVSDNEGVEVSLLAESKSVINAVRISHLGGSNEVMDTLCKIASEICDSNYDIEFERQVADLLSTTRTEQAKKDSVNGNNVICSFEIQANGKEEFYIKPLEVSSEKNDSDKQAASKTPSNDFDIGTQQYLEHGATISVPENWERKEGESGLVYFYPQILDKISSVSPFLMIAYSEQDTSIMEPGQFSDFIIGMSHEIDDFEVLHYDTKTSEKGVEYGIAECSGMLSGVNAKYRVVAFDSEDGFTALGMFEPDNASKDYQLDFEKVIQSISLDESATAPKQAAEYTFSAGNYYVGEDIPQGRYDAVWVSGRGNCFASGMSETFGNTSEHQIKEYKNVELKSGDKVEVHGTLTIKFISK